MQHGMLRIASGDPYFHELIERLAQALEGVATVYKEHPVIRPNERDGTLPQELLVQLPDRTSFEAVHEAVREYLRGDHNRRVTIEHGERFAELRFEKLPEPRDVARGLFEVDKDPTDQSGGEP